VVIPEGATSGNVTVKVYENTVQAGSLAINVLTLYSIRSTQVSAGVYTEELVSIDPATAAVTSLLNISALPNTFNIGSLVYLPATNEIAGIDWVGYKLVKINVATKQTAILPLPLGQNQEYEGFELDKAGNLYTVGYRRNGLDATFTITKVDPATGNTTPVAAFKKSLIGLTYIPATNTFVGTSGTILQKYNLTTGDTSSLKIATTGTNFLGMTVDNNSILYGFKEFSGGTNYSQIVKLDAATGAETVVTTLNEVEPITDLLFMLKRNELLSIWDESSLYRYNLSTNATTLTPLTTAANVNFYDLISN
jgi:hypothetical protein